MSALTKDPLGFAPFVNIELGVDVAHVCADGIKADIE